MNEESLNAVNNKSAIEALLFVSEKPLSAEQIKSVLEDLDAGKIKQLLLELKADYETSSRGLRIEEVAGGFQIVTSEDVSYVLKKFYKQRDTQRLSSPALETLAIVAYKQPLTRLDIEAMRGVNVDGVIKSLLEKNLIRIVGRKDIIGRPFVYGTTRQFLEYFGLNSLESLPKVDELFDISKSNSLLSLSNKTELEINDGGISSVRDKPAQAPDSSFEQSISNRINSVLSDDVKEET